MAETFLPGSPFQLPERWIRDDSTEVSFDHDPLDASRIYLHNYLSKAHEALPWKPQSSQYDAMLPFGGQEASHPPNRVQFAVDEPTSGWGQQHQTTSPPATFLHSPSNSDVSIKSADSVPSTVLSPVFSRTSRKSSVAFSGRSFHSPHPSIVMKRSSSLLDLPQQVLDQIVGYVIGGPWKVSLGPQRHRTHPEQRRQYRARLYHIDIRLIMMNPIFLVSRQLRKLALNSFHRDSIFIIDLHLTKCMADNIVENYRRFWTSETPKMVRTTLGHISNLQLRVSIPSAEIAVGAKYHLPLDEKAGTNWRVKHMKGEQKDVLALQESLRGITSHIINPQSPQPKEQPKEQSRTTHRRGRTSLGRMPGFQSLKSFQDDLEFTCRGETPAYVPLARRQPLKRLEIVLAKRSATSVVLPETLDLFPTWSSIPVLGYTEYFLELDGRKRSWAVQKMGKWQGTEPDGGKLLHDLQSLKNPPASAPPRPSIALARPPVQPENTRNSKKEQQSPLRPRPSLPQISAPRPILPPERRRPSLGLAQPPVQPEFIRSNGSERQPPPRPRRPPTLEIPVTRPASPKEWSAQPSIALTEPLERLEYSRSNSSEWQSPRARCPSPPQISVPRLAPFPERPAAPSVVPSRPTEQLEFAHPPRPQMTAPPFSPPGRPRRLRKPPPENWGQRSPKMSKQQQSEPERERERSQSDNDIYAFVAASSAKGKRSVESMLGGPVMREVQEPPSVTELLQIVEDVRRGLY